MHAHFRRRLAALIALLLTAVAIAAQGFAPVQEAQLEITVRSATAYGLRIFFDRGLGFRRLDSRSIQVRPGRGPRSYRIAIPQTPIYSLRFDSMHDTANHTITAVRALSASGVDWDRISLDSMVRSDALTERLELDSPLFFDRGRAALYWGAAMLAIAALSGLLARSLAARCGAGLTRLLHSRDRTRVVAGLGFAVVATANLPLLSLLGVIQLGLVALGLGLAGVSALRLSGLTRSSVDSVDVDPTAHPASATADAPHRGWVARIVRDGLAPIAFYTLWFCVFCAPILGDFATHFFCDRGDGLQNVWNLWWVRHAIVDLQTNPWFTTALHHPEGTTLLGATLNPFNGVLAIGLSWFFDPPAVHNSIVAFAFVVGGWTAFLLADRLTRSYTGSLLAGFVFTFSCYHFAHAQGHLQLVSLEFLPLFVWLWWSFLEAPGYRLAAAAAAALLLLILCDYYYFAYAVCLGAWLLAAKGWRIWRDRDLARGSGLGLGPLLAFVGIAGATSGALALALLGVLREGVVGAHDPYANSLDLFGLLIPGGHWRFSELTHGYWSSLPGNIHESSVHLGFAVAILVLIAWRRRATLPPAAKPWFGLLACFFVLSLGPALQIAGVPTPLRLPYFWLEQLIPPLATAGTPVRLVVVVNLCAAVLCAFALPQLRLWTNPATSSTTSSTTTRAISWLFILPLLLLEFWPKPIPTTQLALPPYLEAIRNYTLEHPESSPGSVLDLYTPATEALYFQTLHELPLATGYLARVPEVVAERRRDLMTRLRAGDVDALHDQRGVRFVVAPTRPAPPVLASSREIFRSSRVRVVLLE